MLHTQPPCYPPQLEALLDVTTAGVLLRALAAGGLYAVDALPGPCSAPLEGQAARVAALVATMQARDDLYLAVLPPASGMAVATRKPPPA